MEEGGCWADATPAVRELLRWMEPYQLDVPSWGVVERRLRDEKDRRGELKKSEEGEDKEKRSVSILIFQSTKLIPSLILTDFICARVCLPGPISPSVNTSGKIVIAIISSRVVKEIRSGTEAVTVDHPSWSLRDREIHATAGQRKFSTQRHRLLILMFCLFFFFYQILIGSLDSEENHH